MSELKRVLYVEDEPDIQAIAQVALEVVGGFKLKMCSSGQEALDAVSGFAPDLFLLDVMMPDMDGPATLKELRKISEFEKTPMIFMTARVQPDEVKEYLALGAMDVIAKPFDPMVLADQIRVIWERCAA